LRCGVKCLRSLDETEKSITATLTKAKGTDISTPDESTHYYQESYRGRSNLLATSREVAVSTQQEVTAVN